MFDRLSDGFNSVFRKLSGKGKISQANVQEAMEEVRRSLLDADVHLDVVEAFCQGVLSDALGEQVTQSLQPGQEMIGIVHRRLIEFLGGEADGSSPEPGIMRVSPGPTVVMMCGLQGAGKTTTCGKLAGYLKKQGQSVLLVAGDLQRPAAVEQLETVARQANEDLPGGGRVEFYSEPDKCDSYGKAVGVAVGVCQRAVKEARKRGIDTVILDTAGRLHVNDELMGELSAVQRRVQPHQIMLVVDAMTGQDAVLSAKAFHERLAVDGVIMTKFDSDTRGGAALSVKHVTGATIRFVGIGEKLDAIEPFFADRMAGRILGMGDVVSLVEKAQEEISEAEAEKLQDKIAKGEMGMDDFLSQLRTLRKMGPLKQLLGMMPGIGSALKDVHVDDGQLDHVEAMINSMTIKERRKPDLINNSRRKRIARGAGSKQEDISQLVKQFSAINTLSRQMATMSGASKAKAVKEMSAGGGLEAMMPGLKGMPGMMGTKGSTKSKSKKKFKKRR